MEILLLIIESCLLVYFAYSVIYTLIFSITAQLDKPIPPNYSPKHSLRFCVMIPAYKEDAVIVETARAAAQDQRFPKALYDVVVIADSLRPETITKLNELPIKVVTVSFDKSTKVKSLNTAMSQLKSDYDYGIVLDADNIMESGFLTKLTSLFNLGSYKVIQGQRRPKNNQTTMAFLDGVSEAINTSIFRRGTSAAGLSSSISGSGFAADFQLLKQKLGNMDSVGGFDRELELLFLRDDIKVHYQHDLAVFDEKVSNKQSFQNQRKRWISSQYVYLARYFKEGFVQLFSGNLAFFNSSVLRNIQLPRLLNIGFMVFLVALMYLLDSFTYTSAHLWSVLFLIYSMATLFAIPNEFYTSRLLYALIELPAIFFRMVSAFFQMRTANKKFIHTPHEA